MAVYKTPFTTNYFKIKIIGVSVGRARACALEAGLDDSLGPKLLYFPRALFLICSVNLSPPPPIAFDSSSFCMLVLHSSSRCDVCLSEYSWDNSSARPYAIHCGHIFCREWVFQS